jgi:hypothetical protein
LIANVGWVWHHSKRYVNQFNEPIPEWVNDIQSYNRLRLITLITWLSWRLNEQAPTQEKGNNL